MLHPSLNDIAYVPGSNTQQSFPSILVVSMFTKKSGLTIVVSLYTTDPPVIFSTFARLKSIPTCAAFE